MVINGNHVLIQLLFVILVSLPGATAQAQQKSDSSSVDKDMEAILESLDPEEDDLSQLVEQLVYLIENPIDVNTISLEDLLQIPSISPLTAADIIRHRLRAGPFDSLSEIMDVESIDSTSYHRISQYLTINHAESDSSVMLSRTVFRPSLTERLRKTQFEVIHRYTRRLDVGREYDRDTLHTTYPGTPLRSYVRLRAKFGEILDLNLTMERDPGEAFRWKNADHTYGFDYISACAYLHDLGRLKTLIVGDYIVNVGQGVVLWRSSEMGKGRHAVRPAIRSGSGIRPYGSTEENRFFRGLASTFKLTPSIALSAYVSSRQLDATPVFDNPHDGSVTPVKGLTYSGLHRTKREIDQKDAIRETFWGGTLAYDTDRIRAGIVSYQSTFNREILSGSEPYQRFRLSGDRVSIHGTYFTAQWGRSLFFSEFAITSRHVIGGVAGLMMQLPKHAESVVLVRHYPRDFISIHGNPFGERSGTAQNETGFYAGIRLYPSPVWTISAYFDQYCFPWIRYGVPRPGTGYEVLLSLESRPRTWLTYYIQVRSETKEARHEVITVPSGIVDAVRPTRRQSVRLHGDYVFSRNLRLRARIEIKRYIPAQEHPVWGFLLYQDLRWMLCHHFQIDVRYALFDIDDYEARIYAYESDLLYTSAIPAFQGQGRRFYVLIRWTPKTNVMLQCKFGRTYYVDNQYTGSDLNEIDVTKARDIRFQLRWRF